MATRKKQAAPISAPSHPVTEFEVCEGGALRVADFDEAQTRADFFEDAAFQWRDSPQSLHDAMVDCPPLAWAVHSIYSEFRDEIEADLKAALVRERENRERIAALKSRLSLLPEEPHDGAPEWLLGLVTSEFETRIVPDIEDWFSSPPDWSFEDDYLDESGTAQGAALLFFQDMDPDELETLGIDIVEGDRPGSTYYAAELNQDINDANLAALDAGIPVHFRPSSR